MARLAGFEPTTPWFVAKYSIQLSYGREGAQFITGVCDFSSERAQPTPFGYGNFAGAVALVSTSERIAASETA